MGKMTRKRIKINNKQEYNEYKENLDKELQEFTNYVIENTTIDNIIKQINDANKEVQKKYGENEMFSYIDINDEKDFNKGLSGELHSYDYFLISIKKLLRNFIINTIITDEDGYKKIEYNPEKYWNRNNS